MSTHAPRCLGEGMSSEEEEEDPSEKERLVAEFRRLQREARDALREAREENAAYLGDLREATASLDASQKHLLTTHAGA